MVLIKANSILLSLPTKKSVCNEFRNHISENFLHTNLRNRNYDLFELLLLNAWFFFLLVFIFCIFSQHLELVLIFDEKVRKVRR